MGYKEEARRYLNHSKELEAENEKLKRTMQLHAGDCCSLNNEVELFRGHWEDAERSCKLAEERCDELQKALQKIADCDIRHFHSSACYKMNRIANKVLKG